MFNIKNIFNKHCKHKFYAEKEVYNDHHDIYVLQICNKCKKSRMVWINKYFVPPQFTEWK